MNKLKSIIGIILLIFNILPFSVKAQLLVSNTLTPQQWVQNVLVGQGVQVSNVTYTGDPIAAGTFTGNTNIGLGSGVILTSGDINVAPGPNNSGSAGLSNTGGGDPDLAAIANGTIYNAAILEFDFIPESDTVKFRYVFGSDEYHEFSGSNYNDVFGFFISGPGINGPFTNNAKNIALLPMSATPVSINNVNNGTMNTGPCMNCQFLIDNSTPPGATIQYDAFTVVLVAQSGVIPCNTYHIKLAVSDVGDGVYDSGVFLEANSFTSTSLSVNLNYVSPANPSLVTPMAIEGCRKAVLTFTMPFARPDSIWVKIDSIFGSAINGVDYNLIIDSVLVLPYHISTTLTIDPIYDGITEGTEEVKLKIKTSVCGQGDTTLTIPIKDYVNITMAASNDTSVCEGQVPLWTTATGGFPPYSVQWTPIATLNNPNISSPIASPSQTTMYHVEIKDSTRCSVQHDSVLVVYNKYPMISFKPEPYTGCDTLVVNFTNNTTPDIQHYWWDFGDGHNDSTKSPTHVYHYNPSAFAYTVQLNATTAAGCSKQDTIPKLIQVYPNPQPEFTPVPDSTSLDEPTIAFTNTSIPITDQYLWNFGDSLKSTSTDLNPSFIYTRDGYYTVWLYATTDRGCKDSISHKVLVVQEIVYDLKIPNVITPNGDGKNDKFKIENLENYMVNVLSVYDRWGKKVFEQSPYLSEWDGAGLAEGTYYVVLRYKKKKEEFKYDGVVNIVR
ncbi:MAG: choice-of-anchor L domain-containing protein [Bacteroidetes bacterium]|nr:choice-of-anchor L domain-containing protein [Bacteroidota bacterium]